MSNDQHPEFNPFSAEYCKNPHDAMRTLRQHSPIHNMAPLPFWLLTRAEDTKAITSDQRFVLDSTKSRFYKGPDPSKPLTEWLRRNSPMTQEHIHVQYKRVVGKSFSQRSIARLSTLVSDVIHDYSQDMWQTPSFNMVDLTQPIPFAVISRMLGIPPMGEQEQSFRDIAQDFIPMANPLASKETLERGEKAAGVLKEEIEALIDQKKRKPADDMLSDWLQIVEDDKELDESFILIIVSILLSVGSDSTSNAMNWVIKTLMQHPDQLALLRQDTKYIDQSIVECLRYDSPGRFLIRFASEDVAYKGFQFEKGDIIFMSTPSIGRDDSQFNNASQLDITRETDPGFVFGWGKHRCLGMHLAILEIRQMLLLFLQQIPASATLDSKSIQYNTTPNASLLRALATVPIYR